MKDARRALFDRLYKTAGVDAVCQFEEMWRLAVSHTPYMTRRNLSRRFASVESRIYTVVVLPCGGHIVYLREHPFGRTLRIAIGQGDYEPTLDIDRYAVACPVCKGESCTCPAWDALRRELDLVNDKGVRNDIPTVAVDVEGKAEDYGIRWAGVHEENGLIGPILENRKPIGTGGVANIITAAEKCENCREDGGDSGDDADGKGYDVHEGIMAKIIRKLFGEGASK